MREIGAVCIKVTQDDPILSAIVMDSLIIDINKCIDFTEGFGGLRVYTNKEELRETWGEWWYQEVCDSVVLVTKTKTKMHFSMA